MRMFIVLIN